MSSTFRLVLGMSLTREIARAKTHLETIETPWEPYRELGHVFANARPSPHNTYPGLIILDVPWRLVGAWLKCVEQAKDTCNPRYARDLVAVMHDVERKLEARPAIERLGDVA